MTARTRNITGLLLLGGALIYGVAEAITAAAWRTPLYSYAQNWISDLGSTTVGTFQGRLIDSPLHDVMNAGFVIQGVLFAAAVVLLTGKRVDTLSRRLRIAALILGLVTGAGYLLLGFFHGSADAAADGTLTWHFTGAALAIIGANTLAVILGINWWQRPTTRRLGHASVPLGILGLAATVVLLVTMNSGAPSGLIERLAVYPIVLFQIRAALHYLARTTEAGTASAWTMRPSATPTTSSSGSA
ncbi:hypothetical protein B7R22_16595 [Subtercola boreus]|uniref:DUF998 domain-containing protein n=1 Tax=Subtercola boreus TaxID=120213 RepID=A0A3E0VQU1_9MICO|nr:DUF998 domain-containing protein [Subtercola boreus]RFA12246.1 hypothetical protein B7R22_16595 [Subtercola boreus]